MAQSFGAAVVADHRQQPSYGSDYASPNWGAAVVMVAAVQARLGPYDPAYGEEPEDEEVAAFLSFGQ